MGRRASIWFKLFSCLLINAAKFLQLFFFVVLELLIKKMFCETSRKLCHRGGAKSRRRKHFEAAELKSGSVSWAWYGIKLILLTQSEMFSCLCRLLKKLLNNAACSKRFSVLDCLVYGARKTFLDFPHGTFLNTEMFAVSKQITFA